MYIYMYMYIYNVYIYVCVYHLNRCKTSYGFSLICRGWMHGLAVIHQRRHCLSMVISIWDARSTYLPICRSVSTVDQAVTLRCFESTRLPQSVLHASEPSSDFRRNHIADSIKKYLMWLFYSSNNLGWFACFRIQFLPDHIMIHSCLVCVCMCVYIYISLQGLLAGTDGFLLTSLNHFQDFGSVA